MASDAKLPRLEIPDQLIDAPVEVVDLVGPNGTVEDVESDEPERSPVNAIVSAPEGSGHETHIGPKREAAAGPGTRAFDVGYGDKAIEIGDGRGLRTGARELDVEWCPWRDGARNGSRRARAGSFRVRQARHPKAGRGRYATGGGGRAQKLAPR